MAGAGDDIDREDGIWGGFVAVNLPSLEQNIDGHPRDGESRRGTTVSAIVSNVLQTPKPPRIFLTAEWRHLVMLNYKVEPAVLAPFVPNGTELDSFNGQTFVSMVGFLFLHTRVCGMPIPFHRNFEEVNLRFYVRRKAEEGWRRGVVFIMELVPRPAIAFVARRCYHEPYQAVPMTHRIQFTAGRVQSAEYRWRAAGKAHTLRLVTGGDPAPWRAGSEAEFITEHYWGYNGQPDGSTLEYQVEHPPWKIQPASEAQLDCDVALLYGERFCDNLNGPPASAFLAEGSAVAVRRGMRLDQ